MIPYRQEIIQQLLKIQFRVNHLDLYYRIGIFALIYMLITFVWYSWIYSPQKRAVMETEKHITNLTQQNNQFIQQRIQVLNASKSEATKKLLITHEQLLADVAKVEQEINSFQHRFIDEQTMTKLLYSLLQEIPNIYIENFTTLVPNISADINSTPKSQIPSMKAGQEVHYTLTIRGPYNSIFEFLQRIEGLKWQLFWLKLDFKVKKYPINTAIIDFYSMKTPQATPTKPNPIIHVDSHVTRDPFKPNVIEMTEKKDKPKKALYKLDSIVISNQRKFALINSQYVGVGDTVDNAKVAEIKENTVVLVLPEGTLTLYLFDQHSWKEGHAESFKN